jgi:LPXTG-site transpeptidase (sortase) family protein
MRNIGIITILVIFGMSLWRAADRFQPDVTVPAVNAAGQELVELDSTEITEPKSLSVSVEDVSPSLEDPDQPGISGEPDAVEPRAVALKPRQKLKPADQTVISFDRVVIPSLKINTPVVAKPYSELSWDLTTLGQDIALLGNIPNQTSANNIVMAGHVTVRDGSNGPFRYLWKLVPGDQIILEEGNSTYTYTVREQVLVYPDETSVLEDTQTPQLTLITCTTWDEETLSYLRRRVIIADLESIENRTVRMD